MKTTAYYPKTLLEALRIKKEHPEALIYAGGTDFMLAKKQGEHLIFIKQIPELQSVEKSEDGISIGAACVYHALLDDPTIPELLKRVISEIAAPAIRNTATIGGNICNASPAGDTLPILYLLDAQVVLSALNGEIVQKRILPIKSFIQGIRKIDLSPEEIITEIRLPEEALKGVAAGETAYRKVGARKAQAISKLLFCASMTAQDGLLTDFRVAYGSVSATALRCEDIERAYIGRPLAEFKNRIPELLGAYDARIHPIDDQRSTAEYRKQVCLNLLEDFLTTAYSRTVISGGLLIDGSGGTPYAGDILTEGNRIAQIGNPGAFSGEAYADAIQISAEGLAVSPGFIDTHSHSDLSVLTEPEVLPKLMQGITTEVLGQDGISMAPLPEKYISDWRKNLAGLDGESHQINWHYETTENYLKMIEAARPAVHESYLLPHGNVRMAAMGLDDRLPTESELGAMRRITERGMKAGCLGLSSGLIYMPCAYSKTEELIELCKIVAAYDGVFVVHQRSEADFILPSMEEILEIGRKSGVAIHFSHFKICGKNNWKYLPKMLEMLDRAQKEGLRVSFDQYPYAAGSTMLGVILPPWAHDGGTDALVARLKDHDAREKMKADIETGIYGWDNFVDFAGLDGIFVTSVNSEKNQFAVGLSLTELGEKTGKSPLDAAFDLLAEEENAVGMVDFYGLESHITEILKRPEMNACTDGLLSGMPHPRVYGAFPRILGRYVREQKVLSAEEAIAKMTSKAAQAMRLEGRGLLKPGYYADIVVWHPETVSDKGTFDQPRQYPEGIVHVFVEGVQAIKDGSYTGNRNGRVIRKK